MIAKVRQFVQQHPYLSMWVVLAMAMVATLFILGPTEGTLLPREMAVIVIATIILAGLCVWIISWE